MRCIISKYQRLQAYKLCNFDSIIYLVVFSDIQNSDSLSNRLTSLCNWIIYTLTIHWISRFDVMVAMVLKKAALCCFGLWTVPLECPNPSKLFVQFYMLDASLLFCFKLTMWQDGVYCQTMKLLCGNLYTVSYQARSRNPFLCHNK
jgi:hypothetical protein